MKPIVCIIALFWAFFGKAEDMRIIPTEYNVVSDTLDHSIKKGHFVLQGDVKMFSSLSPIKGVQIGCTSSGKWIRTDDNGHFEIELLATDSVVYIHKEGWNEIVIENYDFKDQHRVVMDVYMIIERDPGQTVKRKPVIYLYSEEEMNFELSLDPLGDFTFTYPTYNDAWKGTVTENGISVDGKSYPYLFWEAKSEFIKPLERDGMIQGEIYTSDKVVQQLENKLDAIGFNQKEKTDFITFWGPILTSKKYAFVQFIMDHDYDSKVAELTTTPKPNHSKRVFILYQLSNDLNFGFETIEQTFETVKREGFVLIEWGGAEVKLPKSF